MLAEEERFEVGVCTSDGRFESRDKNILLFIANLVDTMQDFLHSDVKMIQYAFCLHVRDSLLTCWLLHDLISLFPVA